ncbi:MAG: CBS domain-containing protein [Pseudomonadota bacterium]
MRAQEILAQKGTDVITITSDASLDDAIGILAEKNIGAVLVMSDQGKIDGILSERDIMRLLAGAPTGYRETPLSEVMTKDVFTEPPSATVDEMLALMTDKRIRHLPIVENDRLMGFLSIGDVVKYRLEEAVGEANALKSYIAAG